MNKKESNRIVADLKKRIAELQAELREAKKREGIDPNIEVKVKKNQARRERVKVAGTDKVLGHFSLAIEILAEEGDIYVPLSVSSGKKTSGFMYQIEGEATGEIVRADVVARGEMMSYVTVGTIRFAKIAGGSVAAFRVHFSISGKPHKKYNIAITRLNYKTELSQTRYHQYLKPISSRAVKL